MYLWHAFKLTWRGGRHFLGADCLPRLSLSIKLVCMYGTPWVVTSAGRLTNIFNMDSAFSSSERSVSYNEVCSIVLPIVTSFFLSHILNGVYQSAGVISFIDLNPYLSDFISLIDGILPPAVSMVHQSAAWWMTTCVRSVQCWPKRKRKPRYHSRTAMVSWIDPMVQIRSLLRLSRNYLSCKERMQISRTTTSSQGEHGKGTCRA